MLVGQFGLFSRIYVYVEPIYRLNVFPTSFLLKILCRGINVKVDVVLAIVHGPTIEEILSHLSVDTFVC